MKKLILFAILFCVGSAFATQPNEKSEQVSSKKTLTSKDSNEANTKLMKNVLFSAVAAGNLFKIARVALILIPDLYKGTKFSCSKEWVLWRFIDLVSFGAAIYALVETNKSPDSDKEEKLASLQA